MTARDEPISRKSDGAAASPENKGPRDKLLIVDFGSQVTQLIARRVREAGVYCEIAPFQNAAPAFAELQPKAVILSGGPASVPDEGSPRAPRGDLRCRACRCSASATAR